MPAVALYNSDLIFPIHFEEGMDIVCPNCQRDMHIRDRDGYALHFVHNPDMGCGVESEKHKRMKAVISHWFSRKFPGSDVKIIQEERNISGEFEDAEFRRGDVVCLFEDWDNELGNGVVGEAQVFNENKDREEVQRDYFKSGFSVAWVESEDIHGYELVNEPEIKPAIPGVKAVMLDSISKKYGFERHISKHQSSEHNESYINTEFEPQWIGDILINAHYSEVKQSWEKGHSEYEKRQQISEEIGQLKQRVESNSDEIQDYNNLVKMHDDESVLESILEAYHDIALPFVLSEHQHIGHLYPWEKLLRGFNHG